MRNRRQVGSKRSLSHFELRESSSIPSKVMHDQGEDFCSAALVATREAPELGTCAVVPG